MADLSVRYGDGSVAIVTGGASGIGKALAEALGAQGAEVVIADLQAGRAEQVAVALRESGAKASAVVLDVRDAVAVEDLVARTMDRTGRLDVIFNNAGIGIVGFADAYDVADWKKIVDVNLLGVAHGVAAAYPRMLEQGFGHIVNTASLAGLIPTPGLMAYSATKHAVVGLSRSLRAEAASRGVRVSVVCPAVIRTPIFHGGVHGRIDHDLSREDISEMMEKMRPMRPEDLAARVLKRIAKNHSIIVEPRFARIPYFLDRLSRSFGNWFSRVLGARERREIERRAALRASDQGTAGAATTARRVDPPPTAARP